MSGKVFDNKMSKRCIGLSKLLLLSGFLVLMHSFNFTPTVLAATPGGGGGVGGGGSGSGGSGAGHQTSYGWGWVIYSATGSGPTDGFRNGASWANVQSSCSASGSTQVYANIVYDAASTGMIYDYQSSWETFRGHFATGTSVDQGKATAISTSQASSAFSAISSAPYGVDTTGYSFGSTVGWFCYNYTPANWTMSVTPSAVSPTSGPASDAATTRTAAFTHKFKNDGPDQAKGWKQTTYYKNYNNAGTLISQGSIASLSDTGGTATVNNGVTITRTDNFPIPASWTAGYKRCEYISIAPYKSPPGTGSQTLSSAPACFTVTVAGAPNVSVTCDVSNGTYKLSGSAVDSDRAIALALQFYKGSGTSTAPLMTNVMQTDSSGNFSGVNVTAYMDSTASATTFTVKAKGVNSTGAQTSPDGTAETECTVPPCTPGSPGCGAGGGGPTPTYCPGDSTISANSKVVVPLPDQTPPGKTAAPTGYTTNPYATQQQDVPQSKTLVTSVQDISSGGARVGVPVVGNLDNYQTVTLQYQAYVDGMPYDPNQASVTYDSKFQRTDWYVVFDRYQCDGQAATRSGNQCSYNYAAPSDIVCADIYASYDSSTGKCVSQAYYCPAGSYASGPNCYSSTTGSFTGGATLALPQCPVGTYIFDSTCKNYSNNTYNSVATCRAGSLYQGNCRNVSNPYNAYYCNSSSETRTGSTCYGQYGATAYYRWTNNGAYNASIPNTVDAYPMEACFNRNYDVTNVTASAGFDNNEDPSSADVSGSATVDFTVPAGFPAAPNGLRSPVKVNLSFSAGPCPSLSGSRTFNGTGLPSSASSGLDSGNCPVSAPPLVAGDTVCIVYNVFPKTGEVQIDGTPVGAGGTASSPPGCTSPVQNNPYVHVFGLDASAGGNFASGLLDQCTGSSPSSGGISANYRTSGPQTRGSGAQIGALALGPISGFASATLRTSPPDPTASSGLTFANDGANGQMGGQHCVPDYYSTMPSGSSTFSGSFNVAPTSGNGNPNVEQVYSANGDVTINGPNGNGAGVAEGNRISIYVNGDVYINTDIKFKNESWSSADNIPSLFIVAKGNIYVDPSVERLDGVYVAQPNGASGGTINTCAPGFGNFLASALYDSCKDRKLMVNGAFIAKDINFLRTFSSLRTSLGGEQPGTTASGAENKNTPGDCDGNVRTGSRASGDTGHDCAAEIINFSPETYLTSPAMLPVGGPAVGKYDYITSLSPIL